MSRRVYLAAVVVFSVMAFAQDSQEPSTDSETSKPNKVTRKLRKALPDCINIIFSTCIGNSSRKAEASDREEERFARAAERCEKLKAALPASLRPLSPVPPQAAELAPGESSSRTNSAVEPAPYCTAESLLAAEHDVEVGDFYFEDKKFKSAEMRYRSALERIPGEPMATLRLARILEKTGRPAEALPLYQTFMQWSPTGKEAEEAQSSVQRLASTAQK